MHSQALRRSLNASRRALTSTRARPRPTTKSASPLSPSTSSELANRLAANKRLKDDTIITTKGIPPPDPAEEPTQPPETPAPSSEADPSPEDEPEKRAKTRRTRQTQPDPVALPEALDVLWEKTMEPVDATLLPPEDILQEALTNLRITLLTKTQYTASLGKGKEPTLGLYCPIEGGEYLIDATIRELARQTGAEVLEIDAAQIAAGQFGVFGEAATAVKLGGPNPLHFPTISNASSDAMGPQNTNDAFPEEQEEAMTIQKHISVMISPGLGDSDSGKIERVILKRETPSTTVNKSRRFFDAVVNLPSSSELPPGTPRLIYLRDYPTIASAGSGWYSDLLAAVRERRGPPLRPTTIVLGITPSLLRPETATLSAVAGNALPEREHEQRSREKRLQDRLKDWATIGDAVVLQDIPFDDKDDGDRQLPFFLPFASRSGPKREPKSEHEAPFFRTSILIPRDRSMEKETNCRTSRRRLLNELTLRMAVGEVGGEIEQTTLEADPTVENDIAFGPSKDGKAELSKSLEANDDSTSTSSSPACPSDAARMWQDIGNKLEAWTSLQRIADRALGLAMEPGFPADITVPWSAVQKAWVAHHDSHNARQTWTRSLINATDTSLINSEDSVPAVDEVIERIKHDTQLTRHEQRLVSCIVNTAAMPTSFNQVHLPHHTVDSVRTIVSLPLLFPEPFQQGILKTHGLTGCLLFGPPGTGKTLLVRALAKEAGSRMISVMPSDLMDLYVGEGEKLVKALFALAQRMSPVVIFIDEIDALLGARVGREGSGGSALAHRGVITEFMQHMDGLKSSSSDRIVVVGATNRPFDLDDAVLRRLPRRLLIDLPGESERLAILKILLRDENLASDVQIETLAKQTALYSGSDLKNLCVSAALDAVKQTVEVPWAVHESAAEKEQISEDTSNSQSQGILADKKSDDVTPIDPSRRILTAQNFAKGLKEITPSSSETLGSLGALRKWNEEFGEGRKHKKQQVWGKGRFGFIDKLIKTEEDGKVDVANTTDTNSRTE